MNHIQAVITQENAKITCNFEQVEKAIQDKLSEYRGAVFTEESKTFAKKEVAGLRAEKKSLQDNMRDAKKQYMKPWDEFEVQAKRLIGLYDEPIDFINGQVQAFEEKRVAEKEKLIASIYETVPEELQAYIPLERIYNPKWENATYKEKDIKADVAEAVRRTSGDIDTISAMQSEAVEKALEIYKGSLNLSDAIVHINNYERQKQEILTREQEKRRREEEDRIRREEREKLLAEQKTKEMQEAAARQAEEEKAAAVEQAKAEAAQEVIDGFIPNMEGEASLCTYSVSLSGDAKEKLEMYMDSVGIEWELISWNRR